MRVLLTGQVGLDKGEYLSEAKALANKKGFEFEFITVGEEIINSQGGKIDDTTILNLPKSQLDCLRKLAWTRIIDRAEKVSKDCVFVTNSHAVFRWHHGLFPAIELELVIQYRPDVVATLIDDIDIIVRRLEERGTPFFELWEILAWREEEVHFTHFISNCINELNDVKIPFYILPRDQGPNLLTRILTEPDTPRIYLSFSVTGLPEAEKKEVKKFKQDVSRDYIAFDPLALKERSILTTADSLAKEVNAAIKPHLADVLSNNDEEEKETKRSEKDNEESDNCLWKLAWDDYSAVGLTNIRIEKQYLSGREVISIRNAIDGQIISRDYLLIEQSDFVLMHISSFESGEPRISAGSQSEMLYAYSQGKPVYGIFPGGKESLSPWVTQFSEIFESVTEALEYIKRVHPITNTI
ncbi:MAG: AAA family ATPase [Anaerolineales bacterium]|nr:AAA family ATPase [Anaerolineales bacterium]